MSAPWPTIAAWSRRPQPRTRPSRRASCRRRSTRLRSARRRKSGELIRGQPADVLDDRLACDHLDLVRRRSVRRRSRIPPAARRGGACSTSPRSATRGGRTRRSHSPSSPGPTSPSASPARRPAARVVSSHEYRARIHLDVDRDHRNSLDQVACCGAACLVDRELDHAVDPLRDEVAQVRLHLLLVEVIVGDDQLEATFSGDVLEALPDLNGERELLGDVREPDLEALAGLTLTDLGSAVASVSDGGSVVAARRARIRCGGRGRRGSRLLSSPPPHAAAARTITARAATRRAFPCRILVECIASSS